MVLDEVASKQLLARHGVPVPRGAMVADEAAVDDAIRPLSPPFALKVIARGVSHKSDVGGVSLRLPDAKAVRAAMREMRERPGLRGAAIDGFLVEEMAQAGHEIVVGGVVDPAFGPVIMVGLGGVFVEIFGDVAFRVCPISRGDAHDMLGSLKAAPLLAGARGGLVAAIEPLVDVLLAVGGKDGLMMREAGWLGELDINPLIVSAGAVTAVDARIVRRDDGISAAGGGGRESVARVDEVARGGNAAMNGLDVVDYFRPLIEPARIAVVGASATGSGPANNFLRHLRAYGYAGTIYPIHPTADVVDGLPAYRSLGETPQTIDYAYVVVAAERVPDVIRQARGRVRFAQVMSSGFAESAQGAEAQVALLAAAHEGGVRLLGPNCMGTHTPRGRMTFVGGPDAALGTVGVLAQSGGLSIDILRRGQLRGVGFSALITLGNSADLGPADLLEFLLADPATRVIGLYLESVANGRQFFAALQAARGRKPMVLLKGGRTRAGMRASVSHTGALASDDRIWTGLARQTGVAMVDTLDEFLDALLAFQTLAPTGEHVTRRVALFGNGGGTSVLATDAFEREGFAVAPFGAATQSALAALALPAGSSFDNPIDTPANALRGDNGALGVRVIDAVMADEPPDALVMHFNLPVLLDYRNVDIVGQLVQGALAARARTAGRTHFVMVLRTDGDAGIDAQRRMYRAQALAAGVLCVDELIDAVKALGAVREWEAFRSSVAAEVGE